MKTISIDSLISISKQKEMVDDTYNQEIQKIKKVSGIDDSNHGVFSINDVLTIDGKEVKEVFTSDKKLIKISTHIKKTLFKKSNIINVNFIAGGSGFIKIYFINTSEPRIYGCFIKDDRITQDYLKIGSITENPEKELSLWSKNKSTECLYFNITEENSDFTDENNKNRIRNIINLCQKIGVECKFVYRCIYSKKGIYLDNYNSSKAKYENKNFMIDYVDKFINFIYFLKTFSNDFLKISVIFEPYLLSSIFHFHENGRLNPKKVYVNYCFSNRKNTNILLLIKYLNNIAKKCNIGFVNVFNPEVILHNIKLINVPTHLDNIKNHLNKISEEVSSFYNFFTFENTKLLAFDKYYIDGGKDRKNWLWSNDEWNSFLYIVKTILNNINMLNSKNDIKGMLYEIPVGHINELLEKSIYKNKNYENHTNTNGDYEDTSTVFLFGGCFKPSNHKFFNNIWNDFKLKTDKYVVCYGEHLSKCSEYGIKYILFGGGSNISSTHIPLEYTGEKITDHRYTIYNMVEYYNS